MLLEFNSNDKNLIKSVGDIFTISLEFELETDDKEGNQNSNPNVYLSKTRLNIFNFLSDKNNEDLFDLSEEILSQLEFTEEDDDDSNEDIFNEYMDEFGLGSVEHDLVQLIYSDYLSIWKSDDIKYLEDKVKQNLPIFYKKWVNELKFELDTTLNRGIEFSLKKWVSGLDKSIELVKDFYSDFDKQSYWYFSKRTGIHINVGVNYDVDWNILKGFLMISDDKDNSMVFKNMDWRKKSPYTNSLLPFIKKEIESDRDKLISYKNFDDMRRLEDYLSNFIIDTIDKYGYKNFGFNLSNIKKYNYVEFRYPGGKITESILMDKIYYFCYIVYTMIDKDFKRKQYLNKLYKFLDSNINL